MSKERERDETPVSAEEARELISPATAGPWRRVTRDHPDFDTPGINGANGAPVLLDASTMDWADRRLITAARELARTVIALHARAEKAERERDEAEQREDSARNDADVLRDMLAEVEAERDRLAREVERMNGVERVLSARVEALRAEVAGLEAEIEDMEAANAAREVSDGN